MGQKIPGESFNIADGSQQKETPRPPPGLPLPLSCWEKRPAPSTAWGQVSRLCPDLPSIQIYLSVIAESSEHFSISSFSICRKTDRCYSISIGWRPTAALGPLWPKDGVSNHLIWETGTYTMPSVIRQKGSSSAAWSTQKRKTEQLVMPGNLGSFREEGAFELGFKAWIEVYSLQSEARKRAEVESKCQRKEK